MPARDRGQVAGDQRRRGRCKIHHAGSRTSPMALRSSVLSYRDQEHATRAGQAARSALAPNQMGMGALTIGRTDHPMD
jgi:hypothetical protein